MTSLVLNFSIIKIALFYFFYSSYFNYNYVNAIELGEAKNYLAEVNSTMWNIVKNYELSNLPVPDYELPYKQVLHYC